MMTSHTKFVVQIMKNFFFKWLFLFVRFWGMWHMAEKSCTLRPSDCWSFIFWDIWKFINTNRENNSTYLIHLSSLTVLGGLVGRIHHSKNHSTTMLTEKDLAVGDGRLFLSNHTFWQLLIHPWLLPTTSNNDGWFIWYWNWEGSCLTSSTCYSAELNFINVY